MNLPPLPELKVPLEWVRREPHMRALFIADRKAVIEACAAPLDESAAKLTAGKRTHAVDRHVADVLRRHANAIRALLGQIAGPCKHGDPACPCQDGDTCHYEGADAMKPPNAALSGPHE